MRNSVYMLFLLLLSSFILFSSTFLASKSPNIFKTLEWILNLNSPSFSRYLRDKDNILASELGLNITAEDKASDRYYITDDFVQPSIHKRDESSCRCLTKSETKLDCILEQSKNSKDSGFNSTEYSAPETVTREKIDEFFAKSVQEIIISRIVDLDNCDCEYRYSFTNQKANGNKLISFDPSFEYFKYYSPKKILLLNFFEEKILTDECFYNLFGFNNIPSNVVCDRYMCSFYVYDFYSLIGNILDYHDINFVIDNVDNYYFLATEYIESIKERLDEKAKKMRSEDLFEEEKESEIIIGKIKEEALKTITGFSENVQTNDSEILEYLKVYFNEYFSYIENLKIKPRISWTEDENFVPMIKNLYNSTRYVCEIYMKNLPIARKNYLKYFCCPDKTIKGIEHIVNTPLLKPEMTPGISTINDCVEKSEDDFYLKNIDFFEDYDDNLKELQERRNKIYLEIFMEKPRIAVFPLVDFLESAYDIKNFVEKNIMMPEKIEIEIKKNKN